MATTWQIGKRIGDRWEIREVLGGGLGIVYIVFDHNSQAKLAVKTFREDIFQRQPEVAVRFHREALAWIGLGSHPNITKANYVRTIEGRSLLFLEYVPGGDLRRLMKTARLRTDMRLALLLGVHFCRGMEHVRSRGIIAHRDIKPENCLIEYSPITLKVTDFGMVKVFDGAAAVAFPEPLRCSSSEPLSIGMTRTGAAGGTPPYMAPEQFEDTKHVDVRADVYSFGIMLFEMLTGQRPFPGPTWEDFERQHKTQAAPSLSFYPTWLSSIVQQCLQKDPARRFQTFGDLRTHLEAGLGRQPGPSIPSAKPVAEKLTFGEWSDKAGSLVQLGQYREALCCIDRALEYEPKMEQSVEECRKTLGASPAEQPEKLHKFRFGQIWSNKAVVLLKLARLEDALECCDQALKRDPTLILTWSNKGDILTKLGRGEDALACYDRALELDPRSESIWNAKIGILIRLGRDRAAEACYLKAMSLHLCGVRRYGIAGLMSMLGGLLQEKSETAFWRAVDLDSGSGDAWFQRGLEMISQQRAREAMEAFENAARLGHAQAAKHLDSLQRKTG